MLWSKQYFGYDVERWLTEHGHDPLGAQGVRNAGWYHLSAHDVISMPDTWEYPWYAAWDTAFHAVSLALVDPDLDLRSGPVPVPLALHLPSLGVRADVLGVGLTTVDVMDTPQGGLDDPVWGQAFWYRGSAVPGTRSTALIAGHVGSRGGPGVFARLGELLPGDPIVVQDLRTGLGTRFVVTETAEYTLDEAAGSDVMTRIYGAGPVAGLRPEPSADGLAHLTLVTCAGTFRAGTHDRRRVVSAVATGT